MDAAVSTVGLRKTYRHRGRRQVAVERLDLTVPAGGVHGFLGPNGSGKTTTIRMLLGLIRPDSGQAWIFGQRVPDDLPAVIDRVGAIVESPKFFPAFTGRQNLRLLADVIGTQRVRIDEVLEATHLRERADDGYAGYSLGMKQRLAIAATLLKDPDLLIFDEPTNGLDPAGIREIRDTMRALGDRGKTVLVSSHILAEVEQIADTVSIIGRGELLAEGRVADLLGAGTQFRVGVASPDRAAEVLRERGLPTEADGAFLRVTTDDGELICRTLAAHDLFVHQLTPLRPDLEATFLRLTSTSGLDAGQSAGVPAGAGLDDTTGGAP
ncbi:MAG: ATP-binding cassette domain-containing protein [Intrasporangium sp.]|uniref:ABC transporter ATP-binding protein n=1 Tax=Intrasporangium sp. TaxID=1925024 RepID=UPI0026499BF7|nr:ATP-binding cassette domain-containing protein [Intrasporangium sp.]MDN5797774.1 ATP-binding cassette domain-containing protein [Intrasporangium sp.]